MKFAFRLSLALAVSALVTPLAAQTPPAGFLEDAARAGGQADALSLACGKVDQKAVASHKASIRRSLGDQGLSPARFDSIYGAAFDDLMAKAKANPEQTKAACARLAALGSTAP